MTTIECPGCGAIINLHEDATEAAARRHLTKQLEEASRVIAGLQDDLSRLRP